MFGRGAPRSGATEPKERPDASLGRPRPHRARKRESAGGACAYLFLSATRTRRVNCRAVAWPTQSARAAGSGYRRREQLVSGGGGLPTAVPATAAGGHPGLRPTIRKPNTHSAGFHAERRLRATYPLARFTQTSVPTARDVPADGGNARVSEVIDNSGGHGRCRRQCGGVIAAELTSICRVLVAVVLERRRRADLFARAAHVDNALVAIDADRRRRGAASPSCPGSRSPRWRSGSFDRRRRWWH